LQEAYHDATRMSFLKNCPFFDFCTPEVLRNLCLHMTQEIFSTGDYIISFGDLGQEMFFIEDGTVEVRLQFHFIHLLT
jgi:signal-transduction protein with cAMP-binding, CBS, and nucleotidyltransferase domain